MDQQLHDQQLASVQKKSFSEGIIQQMTVVYSLVRKTGHKVQTLAKHLILHYGRDSLTSEAAVKALKPELVDQASSCMPIEDAKIFYFNPMAADLKGRWTAHLNLEQKALHAHA